MTGTVQLYQDMDGEVLMADDGHLPLQAGQAYPGHSSGRTHIDCLWSQESSMTPLSAVDSSLLMRIRGGVTRSR